MAPLLYDYDPFGNIVKTTLKLAENPTPANSSSRSTPMPAGNGKTACTG